MNIDQLDDGILRRIFAYLTLPEQLRLNCVCTRWTRLIPDVCRSVVGLTIQIGDDPASLRAEPVFSIPYLDKLASPPVSLVSTPNPKMHLLQFEWLDMDSTQLLIHSLPAISHLQVSLCGIPAIRTFAEKSRPHCKSYAFDSIIHLLQAWRLTLASLQVTVSFEYSRRIGIYLDRLLLSLFTSINQSPILRYLSIDILGNFYPDKQKVPSTLSWAVLGQLTEFHFNTEAYLLPTLASLEQYALDNPNLRFISLGSINGNLKNPFFTCTDETRIVKLNSKVCHFPYFRLEKPDNLAELTIIRNFSALTRLTIEVRHLLDLYPTLAALLPLTRLLYLRIDFNFNSTVEANLTRLAAQESAPLPELASVRILDVYTSGLNFHTDLWLFKWETLFPNVEVLHYNSGFEVCAFCEEVFGQFLDEVGAPEEWRRGECARHAVNAWSRCSSVKTLLGTVSGESRQWTKADLVD